MSGVFKYIFHRDHFIIVTSAFLQLWLFNLAVFNLDFLNPIASAIDNFSITDLFFEVQHSGSEQGTDELITLVDMSELHTRGDIALMLDEIGHHDPLFVGVDLIFEGEKDDQLGNEMLKKAVESLEGRSVFAKKLTDYDSSQDRFSHEVQSFFATNVAVLEAYVNLNGDMNSSLIRDFSIMLNGHNGQSLSFPAMIASNFDESVSDLDSNEILINFQNIRFPVVSYGDLSSRGELIDGHIILVGAMKEEQDMHNTPLGKMSGLELQAYSLRTLLDHKGVRRIHAWLNCVIAFFLCYLLELTIDILRRLIARKSKSPFFVFLNGSNIISIVIFYLWGALICWILFILFIRRSIIFSGGLYLGLLALVCEGRNLYKSIIKALRAKNENYKFVETSLFRGDY